MRPTPREYISVPLRSVLSFRRSVILNCEIYTRKLTSIRSSLSLSLFLFCSMIALSSWNNKYWQNFRFSKCRSQSAMCARSAFENFKRVWNTTEWPLHFGNYKVVFAILRVKFLSNFVKCITAWFRRAQLFFFRSCCVLVVYYLLKTKNNVATTMYVVTLCIYAVTITSGSL